MWALGCIIAEMIVSKPFFIGSHNTDQLVKIIKVLGTPTSEDLIEMKV